MLVTFHEDAQSDLQDAVFYYEARMVGLGLNLFLDVEDAVVLIGKNPEAYPLIGKTGCSWSQRPRQTRDPGRPRQTQANTANMGFDVGLSLS